jgi:hypothetical protein
MKLRLNKLSVAVAATLAVGAAGQAQATDLLFPYVAVSDSVTTLISVVNPTVDVAGTDLDRSIVEQGQLHYALWYKAQPAADNLAAVCEEVNVFRPTSENDVQTIDLGAKVDNNLGVVFNDPSVKNQWQQNGLSYALAEGLPPLRGWVLVDDVTFNPEQGTAFPPGYVSLAGEAFLFEFESGAAWGYEAGAGVSSFTAPTDFTNQANGVAFYPTGAVNLGLFPTAVMPFDEAFTYFFVTPLVTNMRPGNNSSGGFPAVGRLTWGFTGDNQRVAMYDRDENPVSGAVTVDVRCVGRVRAEDMLTAAALLRVPDGGWGFLRGQGGQILPTGFTPSSSVGMSVMKLEFNDGSKDFVGATPGVFNNGFLLRAPLIQVQPQPVQQ